MRKKAAGLGKAQARTDIGEKPLRLLEGPIICEAFEANNKRGYKLTGKGSYLGLLPGTPDSPCVVSPTEPSRPRIGHSALRLTCSW
jgi:hypothetical protein